MEFNLVIFKGKFILKEGKFDLQSFFEDLQSNTSTLRPGRVDFYFLGNVVSVTSGGFITIYAAVNIPSTVRNIEESLEKLAGICSPYTKGILEVRYRAVNIQISGKFPFSGRTLLLKLKHTLQSLPNILQLYLGCDPNISSLNDPCEIPEHNFLYTNLKLKVLEGKLNVLYTGSYTIITSRFKFIPFWSDFVNSVKNGN